MIHPYAYRAGGIAALISIVWTVIAYLVGVKLFTNWWASGFIAIFILVYLIISIIKIRRMKGNVISFQEAFLNFLVMIAIYAVVANLFNYLLLYVIDPAFGQAVIDASIEKTIGFMEKFNVPESDIEKALTGMEEEFEKQKSFLGMLSGMIKGVAFMAVIGVIVALIVKRKPPVFDELETID